MRSFLITIIFGFICHGCGIDKSNETHNQSISRNDTIYCNNLDTAFKYKNKIVVLFLHDTALRKLPDSINSIKIFRFEFVRVSQINLNKVFNLLSQSKSLRELSLYEMSINKKISKGISTFK